MTCLGIMLCLYVLGLLLKSTILFLYFNKHITRLALFCSEEQGGDWEHGVELCAELTDAP